MTRGVAVLLGLFAAGSCDGLTRRERACTGLIDPDLRLPWRVEIWWGGHPRRDAEARLLFKTIAWNLPDGCPPPAEWFCALITYRDDPFVCEDSRLLVHGCQPYRNQCLFEVGWTDELGRGATIDEVGHLVWEACRGRTGESGSAQDADYAAWVAAVRAEYLTRLAAVQ